VEDNTGDEAIAELLGEPALPSRGARQGIQLRLSS
jgi:hypothetical protein